MPGSLFNRSLPLLEQRRAALLVFCLAITLLASLLVTRMPVQLLPQINYPQIRVISDLPGQTSRVIEESLNEPIEEAIQGMTGLVRMESRSGDGRSYIDLFFQPDYDMDRALRDVTQAVQRAQSQIPDSFPAPRIFEVTTTEEPAMQFAFGSSVLSAPEIRQRLRANLLPRINNLADAEAVYIGREEVPELVVDVDPFALGALGLGLPDIEALLLAQTQPPLSSAMRTSRFEGVGVMGDEGWDAERIARQQLISPVGGTLPLSALANIYRSGSEDHLKTRLNGNPAVIMSIHRPPNAQSLRLAREVHAIIDNARDSRAFEDIEITPLFDDALVTRSAVRSVITAALGGSLLAMFLMLVTLRNRRYVPLVALLITTSLSAAIITLHGLGMSLNLLTLAGLLLSVGLGLDYAIVYFDRLDRLTGRGPHPHRQAMIDVAGPLLGALLTTLVAILPFLFVEGLIALLFQPLIWTVMACAVFSFILALLLLPATPSRSCSA